MGLTIYFLRHGETAASVTGGFCGDLDPELTPQGRLMSEDFADAYRSVPWAGIYSSPLRRAAATAETICRAVRMQPHFEDGLKEIAYGRWEGKSPDDVSREFHDDYIRWLTDPGWNAPTGGQTGIEVARRSDKALDAVEQAHPAGNVLVISHKATIRIMLCSLLGIDIGRFRDRISAPVASVSVVEMARQGPLLLRLGDRSHLRESLRNRPGT